MATKYGKRTLKQIKPVRLKSGKEAIVRPAQVRDALVIANLSQEELLEAGALDITLSEEFKAIVAQLEERLPGYKIEDGKAFFVAEIAGEVIGMVHFENSNDEMQMHQGTFGMAVKKAWRDQGVGRALLQSLLAWGKSDPLIEKIRLEVFSNNERAISLYKSLGFVEEGRLVKQLKLNLGEYVDFILMYRFVNK